MERIVIIGSSCSGKTTMAKQVAAALEVPHIELDALHWLPDWQERPDSEFRELVASAVSAERRVVGSSPAPTTWSATSCGSGPLP
ncbi:MAG: AAA family ATPase [Dehalococcoidia bacterium]|nr:AAA family ATPase [Dehalococcoidia bacterium]